MSRYDFAVLNGRFTPWHEGHGAVAEKALNEADVLILAPGSHKRARSTRDPFTTAERIEIIKAQLTPSQQDRVIFAPVRDAMYNEPKWLSNVQSAVDSAIEVAIGNGLKLSHTGWRDYKYNIALAGMYKDKTSYYINSFPQWDNSIAVSPVFSDTEVYSATKIRDKMFRGELAYAKEISKAGKDKIVEIMERNPDVWEYLKGEFHYEDKYESVWGKGPHFTIDAVITQAGHILLVERGGDYGKGMLALPGGFLERDETAFDGMIRELREETKLKVPEKVLRGCLKKAELFDAPFRSNRSRIITQAHDIRLDNVGELPKVVGASDAKRAKWFSLSYVANNEEKMFEDHWHVIDKLIGFNNI